MSHRLEAEAGPLDDPLRAPLRGASTMVGLGPTAVVAPHPDDETLGCGGAIALLRAAGCPVRVVVVSDGARSHPNSCRYPAAKLRELRERETLTALFLLGVRPKAVSFLGLPDTAVPNAQMAGFREAVEQARVPLQATGFRPQTVLVPWRRDPHCDHRAANQIVRAALMGLATKPRLLEYVIWAWESGDPRDLPAPEEVTAWRLDISTVLSRKLEAIAAYRSQVSDLIDDDPEGFRLTPAMVAHFARPWELYLEEFR